MRKKINVRIPEEKSLCSSKNFHAIAHANLVRYTNLVESGASADVYTPYLFCWQQNKKYADSKETEEYNIKKNKNWKFLAKNDTKALWKAIEYKEKENTQLQSLKPDLIHTYFTDIFQAKHLQTNPVVDDMINEINNYNVWNDSLDENFTYQELNIAIRQSGKGIGFDGLEKNIAYIFPIILRKAILKLFNTVFHSEYPDIWRYLALRPEPKKGHCTEKPKLRGIAVSSLLPSLYDIMIDNRLKVWYKPNSEQAGFRENQGCIIQIFAIYLSIELANSLNESIFIGFIDYEKAFDYINRAKIIKDLIRKNAGATFTKAIANMYQSTYYVPKITSKIKGKPILTKHGVTQGRRSSTNLYSLAVCDTPKSIVLRDSFLHGNNILQLADDSSILTSTLNDLAIAFNQFTKSSNENYMVTNYDKTFYLHLANNPTKDPIHLINKQIIYHAVNNEHLYLGMWITASNDISQHIKNNLKHRAYNIKKYYDWLNINESTPIQIKLRVLDNCMYSAYLYGCECWWKIDAVAPMILADERKLLKRILHCKSNTPTNIIYVELNRCDIITKIKYRQYLFYNKFKQLNPDDSTARNILDLCSRLKIYSNIMNIFNLLW